MLSQQTTPSSKEYTGLLKQQFCDEFMAFAARMHMKTSDLYVSGCKINQYADSFALKCSESTTGIFLLKHLDGWLYL